MMPDEKPKRPSRQKRGYDTDWYRLQESHLAANPVCVRCGKSATQADHMQPFDGVDDPLRLDMTNLQSLCIVCHAEKTAEDQRKKSKPGPKSVYSDSEKVQRHRDHVAQKRREATRAGQDIGAIPAVVNWERRLACRLDLPLFIRTYLAWSFPKPFSADHLTALGKAKQAVLYGGLFAQAAPRGDGKSERTKATALWASLYGHRKFTLMIGATSGASMELLDGVRFYLESSASLLRDKQGKFIGFGPGFFPLLAADFPEIVYPILALDGESKRQGGQRCGEDKTDIHWGGKHITLPKVPDGNWIDGKTIGPAPGAGATLRTTGITGRIRGFNINGTRPDLVLPDDPQTDESAASDAGNEKIERLLGGAVIGLAGPGKKIAGIMPCTVIKRDDAIDRILSHQLHPEWDSSRTKMLVTWPKRMESDPKNPGPSWQEYRDIRNNYDPYGAEGDKRRAAEEATLYYLEHAEAMQEGGSVSWAERFADDELDALQGAMNLYYQDRHAFYSEYQNEPLQEELGNVVELSSNDIVGKLSGVPRGAVPFEAARLTAFIDVQGALLYWAVLAFRDDFTGYVVDYRAWPDQNRSYFTLDQASPTLAKVTGVAGDEAQLKVGLTKLVSELITREWPRENGGGMRLDRILIDSGHQAEVIYHFCRTSPYSSLIMPSKGQGIGSSAVRGIAEGKLNPGDQRGLDWVLPAAKESRGVKLLRFDTNSWKSFVHARLAVEAGLPGSLTLPGKDDRAHRMIADHLTAEYRDRKKSERTGRVVDEWEAKPGHPDNHFFDCVIGCHVAAAMLGAALDGVHKSSLMPKVECVSFSQQQAAARRGKR
jgi:hypothetical protein